MTYHGPLKNILHIDQFSQLYSPNVGKKFDLEQIDINLRDVTFVSPLGAISLLLLFDKLDESYFLRVLPPKDENVVSYMERMNFLKYCTKEVYTSFEQVYDLDNLNKRTRHNRKQALLEITPIVEDEDVEKVYMSVYDILLSHGMGTKDVVRIAWIVSELCSNIIDHSGGKGFAAIQYYPTKKIVQLAIGDNGMGIVNALKPTLLKKNFSQGISDREVVEHAFQKRISSVDDQRGMGLFDSRIKSFEDSAGSTFFMRTHKEVYQITNDQIEVVKSKEYFPGTSFSLEIKVEG